MILRTHILNVSKTLFIKLIFHLQFTDKSFAGILYIFKVCNRSLYLVQSVNIKDSLQFLLKHVSVGKFIFIKFRFLKKKFADY